MFVNIIYSGKADEICGLVVDLFPIALLFAAFEAVGVNLDTTSHVAWRNLPASFVVFLSLGCTWAVAVAALLVIVRRVWITLAVLPLFVVANLFGVFGLISPHLKPNEILPNAISRESIQWHLWLPILFGLMLCAILWRTWLRLEIG